jgi:hypothetical protein
MAPSGPTVSATTPPTESSGTLNSVTCPLVVMRPMPGPLDSPNQRLPSGPATIVDGRDPTGSE